MRRWLLSAAGLTLCVEAFLDESSRLTRSGYCYVIAAAVTIDDQVQVREAMRELRAPRSRVVHWHDEKLPDGGRSWAAWLSSTYTHSRTAVTPSPSKLRNEHEPGSLLA